MQLSASTGSLPGLANLGILSLGKDLGKPRSLVVPRGSERSWSSPALAAAFSLRKYAVQTSHIPGERPKMKFQGDALDIKIEEIDLCGGNGKWRQIKADEHFKRLRLEEEEQHRQELFKAAQKKKRQAELADRKRRHQEDEERRWQEERQQKQKDKEEKNRVKQKQEEKVRVERQAAEVERQKLLPRPCETCDGTAKCQDCMGKGYTFSTFLVSSKCETGDPDDFLEHGRVHQGCDKCGGYSHNMLGDLKKGTGQCAACQGLGKIWPVNFELQPASPKGTVVAKGSTMQASYQSERSSEVRF